MVGVPQFHGVYCMQRLGMGLNTHFSTIMITTSSQEMDELHRGSTETDELMEKKLVFDNEKGRFIPANVTVD